MCYITHNQNMGERGTTTTTTTTSTSTQEEEHSIAHAIHPSGHNNMHQREWNLQKQRQYQRRHWGARRRQMQEWRVSWLMLWCGVVYFVLKTKLWFWKS